MLAASFCPTYGHASPIESMRAFVDAAKRAGADIRQSILVDHVALEGGKAAGVATRRHGLRRAARQPTSLLLGLQ